MKVGSATLPAPVQAIVICVPRLPLALVTILHDVTVMVGTDLAAVACPLTMPATAATAMTAHAAPLRRAVPLRAQPKLVVLVCMPVIGGSPFRCWIGLSGCPW